MHLSRSAPAALTRCCCKLQTLTSQRQGTINLARPAFVYPTGESGASDVEPLHGMAAAFLEAVCSVLQQGASSVAEAEGKLLKMFCSECACCQRIAYYTSADQEKMLSNVPSPCHGILSRWLVHACQILPLLEVDEAFHGQKTCSPALSTAMRWSRC